MFNTQRLKESKELPKFLSVIIDQGFMSITTLLTTVVLARTYSKSSYADLVLLFSITLFILGFQSAIISKPYAINLNDFTDKKSDSYFQFNILLKILFTAGIVLLFPLLYYFSYDGWDSSKFFLFLAYIIAHSSYFFVRETLLSERKTKQNLVYGLVCSFFLITTLVVILYFKLQDIRIFLITATVVYSIIALFYGIQHFRRSQWVRDQSKDFWKINWKVGKWLLGSNFLFHVSSSIYPWLLLYITVKDDVATFGVLMSIASLVNPVLTALSSYLLPVFVRMNRDYGRVNSAVNQWTLIFSGMGALLVAIGYFLGQYIITLFFGVKYDGLGFLVVYPFIVQAINISFQPFKIALNAVKRTDVNFWILIPRSMISVGLGYILISKFGISGVFYTMMVENLFYQTFYYVLYKRIITPKLAHE